MGMQYTSQLNFSYGENGYVTSSITLLSSD